jgi:cytochrome c oxidase subunit IV
MSHKTYEESKKAVVKGLFLLGAVTLVEVFISLFGKGYIFPAVKDIAWIAYPIGLIIAILSVYKAYFIIYEFMHMAYEVKSLAITVLLPTSLLIWALFAFFQEGSAWKARRELVKEKNKISIEPSKEKQGFMDESLLFRL